MDYVSAFSFWTKAILPVKIVETAIPSELNLLHFIFIGISLLGAGVGSYLIFLKKHNLYMGVFIIAMAAILLELTLLWWDGVLHIPKIPFYSSISFLLGPSLFLYIQRKVYPHQKMRTAAILQYFVIFIISLLSILILTNTNSDMPGNGLRLQGVQLLNSYYLKSFYFAFFLALIIKQYMKYRKRIDSMDRNWLRILVIFFVSIFLISIIGALFKDEFSLINVTRYIIAYFFSVFIIIISFLLYLFPAIVTEPLQIRLNNTQIKEKYQNSGLTIAMASTLRLQLLSSMEEKMFLDPTLSLETLAKKLNTDRYSLSQVINQEFNKNFYEFINDYRINECLAHIDENPHQIDSISDLIYASGFNNKVSFYNAFKKRKSMTPVQYIKALNQ